MRALVDPAAILTINGVDLEVEAYQEILDDGREVRRYYDEDGNEVCSVSMRTDYARRVEHQRPGAAA